MARCLIALGSNVGDRAATLDGALRSLDRLPEIRVQGRSQWQRFRPVGCAESKRDYLNGAALLEVQLEPADLMARLLRVEAEFGRRRTLRWADRALDLDLLLYDQRVFQTESLVVPHARMSFRRFVLEGATDVAPEMVHPTIGWNVRQLLVHLNEADDWLAVVAPSASRREHLASAISARFHLHVTDQRPKRIATTLWPAELTTWMRHDSGARLPRDQFDAPGPKLTILFDDCQQSAGHPTSTRLHGAKWQISPDAWSAVVRQAGRGPSLHVSSPDEQVVELESLAAVESVWPDLCH